MQTRVEEVFERPSSSEGSGGKSAETVSAKWWNKQVFQQSSIYKEEKHCQNRQEGTNRTAKQTEGKQETAGPHSFAGHQHARAKRNADVSRSSVIAPRLHPSVQASHLGGLRQSAGFAVGFAVDWAVGFTALALPAAFFRSSSSSLRTFWGVKMMGFEVHLVVSPFLPSSIPPHSRGGSSMLLIDSQVALRRDYLVGSEREEI